MENEETQEAVEPEVHRVEILPQMVCSQKFIVEISDNKIVSFSAIGGCSGNLRAIGVLIKDMPVDDVIAKLKDVGCNNREVSCASELAAGLKAWKEKQENK